MNFTKNFQKKSKITTSPPSSPEQEILEALQEKEGWITATILDVEVKESKASGTAFFVLTLTGGHQKAYFSYTRIFSLLQVLGIPLPLSDMSFETDDLLGRRIDFFWVKDYYEGRKIYKNTGVRIPLI